MKIELSPVVEDRLRDLAHRQNREVSALVEEAIGQYLDAVLAASITDLRSAEVSESQLALVNELVGEMPRRQNGPEAPPRLNPELRRVLLGAYAPCPAFTGACRSMRWAPQNGHVPRGFCGASGELRDVRLVLVVAEPGDPHDGESHYGNAEEQLGSAYRYAYECFRSHKNLFHRNVMDFLESCWPNVSFHELMRRTWITESVLCSAAVEGGYVPAAAARECRKRYLEAQLALLRTAVVVALGQKAQWRLRGVRGVINACSAAPPGGTHRQARESLQELAKYLRSQLS